MNSGAAPCRVPQERLGELPAAVAARHEALPVVRPRDVVDGACAVGGGRGGQAALTFGGGESVWIAYVNTQRSFQEVNKQNRT